MAEWMGDGAVAAVREAVEEARTADDALAAIADFSQDELSVSRAGIRMRRRGADDVMVAAVWSKVPTQLDAGRTHLGSGSVGEVFDRVVRSQHADIHLVGEGVVPLLEEGNRSALQIPLALDGRVLAVLTIMSSREDAFLPGDLKFYEHVGEALAPIVLPLARAAIDGLSSRA
ncbi:MAG: hypothetical protein QOI81_477 [Actinomycetota bacterium]|jgi:hypothetical protein|nr:hypothetical protein [Actinomycetota bacterium]